MTDIWGTEKRLRGGNQGEWTSYLQLGQLQWEEKGGKRYRTLEKQRKQNKAHNCPLSFFHLLNKAIQNLICRASVFT